MQRHCFVVVATNYLIKWIKVKVLISKNCDGIAQFFFDEVLMQHNCLEEFLFVNGTKFCIAFLNILAINMEVKHKMTSSYHPQCNGFNEQFTSTLYMLLDKNGRYDKYWYTMLRSILFAYYTSISYMAESLDHP